MRIGITGSQGFVGWHLRCLLFTQEDVEARLATRETFADPEALRAFVGDVDVVVHLAGVNRAPEQEVYDGNVGLADQLVEACEAVGATPHLVFASSTHTERESPTTYGRSKLACAERLEAWADREGATCTTLIIPHVFGEYGRPFYNSAVATFCHQLASGEGPVVENDAPLELLHVQDLCDHVLAAARAGEGGARRLSGTPITVRGVLARLEEAKRLYDAGVLPDLDDPFSTRLFNTLRSYYYPGAYPVEVVCHRDPRGHLFETVKGRSGGQCFVSTTKPGITRGNHFHRHKFERFFVLSGTASIKIRRLFDDEVREFVVDGSRPAYVDIPTLQTHDITNIGEDELVTLFWSNEIFDPRQPDTYAHPVQT